MDLSQIENALKQHESISQFDKWIIKYESKLSNYFYKLTGQDLNELSFDSFYFKVIVTSGPFQEYHAKKSSSDAFNFFLNLISVAAEKLALIGLDSISQNILGDLPVSASKYRLIAINQFALVEDIRTSYINEFPQILETLAKSKLFEDGNNRQVVDVLVYYYKKAKKNLEGAGLHSVIKKLKALFLNEKLNNKYPFLSHQILLDLLTGTNPFALYPKTVQRERLEPSRTIRGLFTEVNLSFFSHPSIDHDGDNYWGFDRRHILENVLVRGRGDFTTNSGKITVHDKVLLYCFFNMKKHFFTSYAVFQTVTNSLEKFFSNQDYKPVFIDLGCGPMTSGLALADLIHTTTKKGINFSYIGVDISNAMMDKAKSFQSIDIFSNESTFHFTKNWNDIQATLLSKLAGKNNPIIFNASYLFSSSSLDPKDLSEYVLEVSKSFENVFFIFQNPNRIDRNVKYEIFKKKCKQAVSLLKHAENIHYKAASVEANEDVSYEILKL